MNQENINELKNLKQQFFLIMDFLKKYLGVISTSIIFVSFALGAWILTEYYIFNAHFIPDFNKDLIFSNIFSIAWIGFIFVSFFLILYLTPLIFFNHFLKNTHAKFKTIGFYFLTPIALANILLIFLFYKFLNAMLGSIIIFIAIPLLSSLLFYIKFKNQAYNKKEFLANAIEFFLTSFTYIYGFFFNLSIFKYKYHSFILLFLIYHLLIYLFYKFIYEKQYLKVIPISFIPAFIFLLVLLNPYIIRISKIGNYNQSFALYNKTEVKELLNSKHIPIFKENNATLFVKDLYIVSNLGEKYLIKNDQNETFTLNKQDIFSLLDKI